jgi:hypothetical protein
MLRRSLFPVRTMRSLWANDNDDNNNNDDDDDRPDNNDNNACAYYDDHFNDFHDNDVHKYKFNDHNDRPELARMRRDGAGNSRLDDHFSTFRDPGNGNLHEGHRLLPVQ